MLNHLDKVGLHPCPFDIDFDTCFLVDDGVMQNPWQLELVSPSRIGMEYDLLVGEVLHVQGCPVTLGDGARTGGMWNGSEMV